MAKERCEVQSVKFHRLLTGTKVHTYFFITRSLCNQSRMFQHSGFRTYSVGVVRGFHEIYYAKVTVMCYSNNGSYFSTLERDCTVDVHYSPIIVCQYNEKVLFNIFFSKLFKVRYSYSHASVGGAIFDQ